MDLDDPFSRDLRSALDRIAELQRRSVAEPRPGQGLLPEVLAELDVAMEELSVTGEELRSQTHELATIRQALEAERQRYQELFESAPVAYPGHRSDGQDPRGQPGGGGAARGG